MNKRTNFEGPVEFGIDKFDCMNVWYLAPIVSLSGISKKSRIPKPPEFRTDIVRLTNRQIKGFVPINLTVSNYVVALIDILMC